MRGVINFRVSRNSSSSHSVFCSTDHHGLCTLWFFNFVQYTAHTVGNKFNRASPTEIVVFNLFVVSAYAGFILGIRAWKLKTGLQRRSTRSPPPSPAN